MQILQNSENQFVYWLKNYSFIASNSFILYMKNVVLNLI